MIDEQPEWSQKYQIIAIEKTTRDNIITIYHFIQIFYFMKILIINWVFIKRENLIYRWGGFNIYLMMEYMVITTIIIIDDK